MKAPLVPFMAAFLATAPGVRGQSMEESPAAPPTGIDLRISLGVFTPVGGEREMAYISDDRVVTLDGAGPLMAVGLSMRLGRPGSAWSFGPSLFRAPSAEVGATYDCRRELEVPCFGVLIRRPVDVAATHVTVDAEFTPARGRLGLSSTAVAGVGVRWDSVRWSQELNVAGGSETRTGPAGKVGAALRWRWTDAAVSLNAADHLGWQRDPGPGLTHDLVLSLALEWRP